MTLKRFFAIAFIELGVMVALRFFYFNHQLGDGDFGRNFYYLLVGFAALVLGRRLNTINFFEALFSGLLWVVLNVFFDLMVTAGILGTVIFKSWELWIGYLIMPLVLLVFHKKRHIEIRKKLHAHH